MHLSTEADCRLLLLSYYLIALALGALGVVLAIIGRRRNSLSEYDLGLPPRRCLLGRDVPNCTGIAATNT